MCIYYNPKHKLSNVTIKTCKTSLSSFLSLIQQMFKNTPDQIQPMLKSNVNQMQDQAKSIKYNHKDASKNHTAFNRRLKEQRITLGSTLTTDNQLVYCKKRNE